jgi:hypothetical protein
LECQEPLRSDSLKTVPRELAKCKLDLMGVQEVSKGSTAPADDYTFLCSNGNADHHLGAGTFLHKGIISAVKRTEFVSVRMSYNTKRPLV